MTTQTEQQIVSIADGFAAVAALLDDYNTRADLEGAAYLASAMMIQLTQAVRQHPSWQMSSSEHRDTFEAMIKVNF